MATEGGEQRTVNKVPAPVFSCANCFIGTESLVAWFVCCHGLVSAVVLAIFVVMLGEGDAYHRMCEAADFLVWSSGVEILAAMVMLALLFLGLWSPMFSFFALCMVFLTVSLSGRLLYFALFGRDCCFIGDTLKAAVPLSVVVLGQLAFSFWGAKVIVAPHKSEGNYSQSQTSVHCTSSQQG